MVCHLEDAHAYEECEAGDDGVCGCRISLLVRVDKSLGERDRRKGGRENSKSKVHKADFSGFRIGVNVALQLVEQEEGVAHEANYREVGRISHA